MSTGIIVMGHGHFATGITSALELIMGSQPAYEALDFPAESDKEDLKKRLSAALERREKQDQIIILTDLFSGTPFNVAMEAVAEKPGLKLYYGLNLGMLMELISRRMFQGDAKLSEGLIEIGRQQVGLFDPEAMEAYTETGEDEL